MEEYELKHDRPEQRPGKWNVDSLKEYIDMLLIQRERQFSAYVLSVERNTEAAFKAQADLVQSTIAAADKAVQKAEAASEKRFDSVNEFRALVADQQRTLMPRSEAEIIMRGNTTAIETIRQTLAGIVAKDTGTQSGMTTLIAIAGFAMALISFGLALWNK